RPVGLCNLRRRRPGLGGRSSRRRARPPAASSADPEQSLHFAPGRIARLGPGQPDTHLASEIVLRATVCILLGEHRVLVHVMYSSLSGGWSLEQGPTATLAPALASRAAR